MSSITELYYYNKSIGTSLSGGWLELRHDDSLRETYDSIIVKEADPVFDAWSDEAKEVVTKIKYQYGLSQQLKKFVDG